MFASRAQKGDEKCSEIQKKFQKSDDTDAVEGTDAEGSSESETDEDEVYDDVEEEVKMNEAIGGNVQEQGKIAETSVQKPRISKGEQPLISKLWAANSQTSPHLTPGRSSSPSTVRRMEDRSPDESGQQTKKERKKKGN